MAENKEYINHVSTVHWFNNANIGARRICEGVIKAEEISVTELDLADLTHLSVFKF